MLCGRALGKGSGLAGAEAMVAIAEVTALTVSRIRGRRVQVFNRYVIAIESLSLRRGCCQRARPG